ncbi:MAG: methyltransferase [Poseidonia sp.]
MGGNEPFDSTHAERELERMNARPVRVGWAAPSGEQLALVLPPTVYPPREDTDLLLSALNRQLVNSRASWLEIGCGSGVLSWWAAKQGCAVTACDVNPLAVACTRALLSEHGLIGKVFEGGPGPSVDGDLSQWGGDRLYDVVVWNMPYLSSQVLGEGALGPMEEAALTDTDDSGLLSRFLSLLKGGRLLTKTGVAFLTVSSSGIGHEAEAIAWSHGLAGRTVATTTFDDGERLDVLAVWRPYADSPVHHVQVTASTNDDLMSMPASPGTSVVAEQQTQGRGRHGRGWETQPDALLASWLVANDGDVHHRPMDQLRVGEGVVRLLQTLAGGAREGVLLKWPNDIWIRSKHGRFAKAGGVLFEAVSQGKNTKLVLGLGLNTKVNHEHTWSGTLDLNISLSTREIHTAVHALVSSLFEVVTGLGPMVDGHTRIEAAVLNGSKAFKELFYRGERVSVSGVDPSGKLVLSGRTEGIDDPEDLTWSIR